LESSHKGRFENLVFGKIGVEGVSHGLINVVIKFDNFNE
jgi:hypothetical protein